MAIRLDGAPGIVQVVAPDLKRANDGESILNIVERRAEEMPDLLPISAVDCFQSTPIQIRLKASAQLRPLLLSGIQVHCLFGVLIHPVLEGVPTNDARQVSQRFFQTPETDGLCLLLRTES